MQISRTETTHVFCALRCKYLPEGCILIHSFTSKDDGRLKAMACTVESRLMGNELEI